jgi:hypothetical protein
MTKQDTLVQEAGPARRRAQAEFPVPGYCHRPSSKGGWVKEDFVACLRRRQVPGKTLGAQFPSPSPVPSSPFRLSLPPPVLFLPCSDFGLALESGNSTRRGRGPSLLTAWAGFRCPLRQDSTSCLLPWTVAPSRAPQSTSLDVSCASHLPFRQHRRGSQSTASARQTSSWLTRSSD